MTPSDPAELSLVEAVDAVRRRDVSSVELLSACLARLDTHGAAINVVTWLDREGAFAAARMADTRLRQGTNSGPLHGMPMAHKDMFYRKGQVTTCGSAIRRDFVPGHGATVLDRLTAAGSYAFAGLNMAEFAQNGTGHNAHFGDCRNPWDPARITGGSSSGSGAAVAAGITYASLGSDTGGSIRLPAAANGVTGIKPTQTRVSRFGVMPLSFSEDNVGPLARSARDCARILHVIAGHDAKDPTSARISVPDYEASLDGDLRRVRIGIPLNFFLDHVAPAIRSAYDAALEVLAERGATLLPVTLPNAEAANTYAGLVSRVEAATIHAEWLRTRPADFATHIAARMVASLAIPATYYIEALSRRGPILRQVVAETFAAVDLLALPTIRSSLPTRADTDIDTGPPGTHRISRLGDNTRAFNYLGLPSASVPCGFDLNGLPIGLSLAGRPFAEATVLRAADAFQRDTGWHMKRPFAGAAETNSAAVKADHAIA